MVLTRPGRLWYHPRTVVERTDGVGEPNRDDLRAAWRKLARRNDWALVEDEEPFLDLAAAELDSLNAAGATKERAEIAVWRAYSALLYRHLWRRQERAAQELWLACVRLALRGGRPRPEAEELAQETIARVLEKLPSLRSPQSMLSWAITIFRTVQREQTKKIAAVQPLQPDDDEVTRELADPADMALEVEQRLTSQALVAQLRAKLPNDLERTTLLRVVVLGEHPRDVARELGLPLYRTRVAKSRAIQRLSQDEELLALLRELAGDPNLQPARTGANDHDR